MPDIVTLEVEDSIAKLCFNRPDRHNAFNADMAKQFHHLALQVAVDDSIRAVILGGCGEVFMVGGDIQFFYDELDNMPAGVRAIIQQVTTSVIELSNMPKPVLAAVHGAVAGIGISFMLAADLVMAADNTQFNLAYTGIGTTPDGGATYFLPRVVGSKKAMELLLLSERFDAKIAQQLGLVNWVVAASEFEAEVDSLAQRLAKGPTLAYARTKRLLNQSWEQSLNGQCEAELQAFIQSTTTEDFRQGVTAFIKRSKPDFIGK